MTEELKEGKTERLVREAWNAAIEAAAKITEHSGYAEQIRKLKK